MPCFVIRHSKINSRLSSLGFKFLSIIETLIIFQYYLDFNYTINNFLTYFITYIKYSNFHLFFFLPTFYVRLETTLSTKSFLIIIARLTVTETISRPNLQANDKAGKYMAKYSSRFDNRDRSR